MAPKIQLKENPEYLPEIETENENGDLYGEGGYFTETLAKIYIKQGRYSKALEIIKRLNLNFPKKNIFWNASESVIIFIFFSLSILFF